MKIELNAVELEAAVISHLTNSGLDMKKKDITFQFEGTCSLNIEDQDATTAPKKAPVKRAPKKTKPEPVVEKTIEEDKEKPQSEPVPKAKAAKKTEEKPVVEDAVQKPVADTSETAEDLFGTPKSEVETESDTDATDEDTSLFG